MNNIKKSVELILPAMRISIALSFIAACLYMGAIFFGLIPNETKFLIEARKKISESIAIQFLVINPQEDLLKTTDLIRYIIKRNPEVLSIGIRSSTGDLIYESVNHEQHWKDTQNKSLLTHIDIPLYEDGKLWGNVELRFQPMENESIKKMVYSRWFKSVIFFIVIGFFSYLAFMIRTLRQLDPSSVIPERVNAAFDTLSEGIIIIDGNEHILMVNTSFSTAIEHARNSLIGKKISEFKWELVGENAMSASLPWLEAKKTTRNIIAIQLAIKSSTGKVVKYSANASPILNNAGAVQGVLITLSDITELEKHNAELKSIVSQLKKTQIQVKQKNKELTFLATHDPLTGCLNRRSLYEQFEALFSSAQSNHSDLSCLMIDIDHFKSINDNHGHARGDEIIKMVANVLKSSTRQADLVGRYGGEEFCVVLPGTTQEVALKIAERIRIKFFEESGATVSIGLSTMHDQPKNAEDLNHKSDEALYVAKRSGRNRVVEWRNRNLKNLYSNP